MTDIRPFRAHRYDLGRVDLSRVIVPPYDVIADDERGAYYDRDRYNAIRLELVRDAGSEAAADYHEVRDTLAAWIAERVLVRDPRPAFYAMRQRFTSPDGGSLERTGFFAALKLEDYSARIVRPHERTLAGPKADRLKMMRATHANLSSVFMLYEDRAGGLSELLDAPFRRSDAAWAKDDAGVEYGLARLDDPAAMASVRAFLADRPVVIADGHHRYETALAYRDERRAAGETGANAPADRTLAFFANAFAPGNLLLPIHRVVVGRGMPDEALLRERLPGWNVERVAGASPAAIGRLLREKLAPHASQPAFAADAGSGELRVYWRPEPLGHALMVERLEREVLGGVFGLDAQAIRNGAVHFPKSAERAAREAREGQGGVALYLNPLTPDDVFRATEAGDVMPQKSTFFYPKVPTGLVFRLHEAGGPPEGDA
jgi:uncharacterized protein (DUF1015 family)